MAPGSDDVDPEAVLERRERRVSRQGHAAVAGALTVASLSAAVLVVLVTTGTVDVGGFLPVFSVAGLGALGGAWLNGTLIKRATHPTRWFRRVVGVVLAAAAALLVAAYVVDPSPPAPIRVLAAVFAVAWVGAVAVTWRFR